MKDIVMIRITTLIEDNPDNEKKLLKEHGLALFVEADGMNILFDTGQSGDFIQNAEQLQKDITALDYMIISHGHYDHSGGLERLLNTIETLPPLIVGANFFLPKYKKIGPNEYKYIGNLLDEESIINKQIELKKVIEDAYYLSEKVIIFHNFQRITDFENLNNKFFTKQGKDYIQDDFSDEVALGIITEKGLVVIVGCSHVGIVNIVQTISKRMNIPIFAIIGGTHLIEADKERMEKTISSFQEMKIQLIAVSHCTGDRAIKYIKQELQERFMFNNTGNVMEL